MKPQIIQIAICLGMLFLWTACEKKIDFEYDNRDNSLVSGNSMIRLVNTTGAKELIINGDSLTSFIDNPPSGTYTPLGTKYFPKTGRLGLTYYIPQEFVNKQNKVPNIVFGRYFALQGIERSWAFSPENNYNAPMDYYLTWFTPNENQRVDSIFKIPRAVTGPTNPANIKIRVLNLSSGSDPANLNGPLTLAFSDGEMVNSGLSNIEAGKYSDYIEIPWGTYQFKVLTADGRQLPGAGVSSTNRLASGTTYIDDNSSQQTKLTYAPTKTYQPGGVYTIAVSANSFVWTDGNDDYAQLLNSFRIVTDVNSVNTNYGRIQAINVTSGEDLNVHIGKVEVASALKYANASAYTTLITGDYEMKVTDKNGIVTTLSFKLNTADNLTAWIYKKASGERAIALISNNLSSTRYIFDPALTEQDGSNSQRLITNPFLVRFLNFCPQVSESTFTTDNGQLFTDATASQHINFAQTNAIDPYISNGLVINTIQVYASKPNVIPGNRIWEIAPLPGTAFITNPEMYKDGLPKSEPGIYTVALIGSLEAGVPEQSKAKMIIIKHIK